MNADDMFNKDLPALVCPDPHAGISIPGTITVKCARCDEPVALSPQGQAFLSEHPEAQVICFWCCRITRRPGEEIGMVPGAREAVERLLGPTNWDELVASIDASLEHPPENPLP